MANRGQHERRKRRAAFIGLQNHVSSLELRVKKFCEAINFEILVEPVKPSVCERQRYVVQLNPDANEELNVEEYSDHPLKMRIYQIKKIQNQYKSLKEAALEKFAELEEEYKHENVNIILLEYKSKPKSDEDSSSDSDSESAITSESTMEFKTGKERNSNELPYPQTGSETETAAETESVSKKESDSESSHGKTNDSSCSSSMNRMEKDERQNEKRLLSFYDILMLKEDEERENDTDGWQTALRYTNDLVTFIFGDEFLATNTSSSKSDAVSGEEPVFQKNQLDVFKLEDIIEIICSKYNITELSARNMIATKCADAEYKLRRKFSDN